MLPEYLHYCMCHGNFAVCLACCVHGHRFGGFSGDTSGDDGV